MTGQRKIKATELNIGEALRERAELNAGGLFALDTFSGETLLLHPIPRPGVDQPAVWPMARPVTDIDITHLIEWLQANRWDKVSRSIVDHAVDAEGHRNQFNSVQDHLTSLPAWDGTLRIDNFFIDYCGADAWEEDATDDEVLARHKYLQAVARCMFIAFVARTMKPGCQVDTMVVLEGPQGSLKSSLVRALAFDKPEWSTSSLPSSLADKDAKQGLRGCRLFEWAEMDQMKRSGAATIKNYITTREDRFRPSYGKRTVLVPRQCVFIGSANESDYLSDQTGNRRFWPVRCGRIDIVKVRADVEQLWAEALVAFNAGEPWWFDEATEAAAQTEQAERLQVDPLLPLVEQRIEELYSSARTSGKKTVYIRTHDVLENIDDKRMKFDRNMEMRIAGCMKALGGKRLKRREKKHHPQWMYAFDVPT